MTSVTRFLRQIPTGLTTYTVDTANLYALVPTAGNYVGNYPPGYMVSIAATNVGGPLPRVVRDMGKTVFAGISSNGGTTVGNPGYFRAVQILSPVSVATPTSSTNFGVQGSVPGTLPAPGGNPGDMGYNTFYIPIVVNGILAQNASVSIGTNPLLAGQL